MSYPGFTVAHLHDQAGDDSFRAAGKDIADIDGPHEDEWSLYCTITLDDGKVLETILHHGTGLPLDGDCNCRAGKEDDFCAHLVWVGLIHLGLATDPADALAAEIAPTEALRPWLVGLTHDELVEIALEGAEYDPEFRRRLHLRSRGGTPT